MVSRIITILEPFFLLTILEDTHGSLFTRQCRPAFPCCSYPAFTAPAANAGVGDLLVAPTRVVLNGRRGTEVILNNIGDDVATYRISAELRRMTPDGKLDDVADPNTTEKAAQEMILYAPRKVTLPPNQPQAIRLSARAPEGLPDGEYRVHMLFRAIPDAASTGRRAEEGGGRRVQAAARSTA